MHLQQSLFTCHHHLWVWDFFPGCFFAQNCLWSGQIERWSHDSFVPLLIFRLMEPLVISGPGPYSVIDSVTPPENVSLNMNTEPLKLSVITSLPKTWYHSPKDVLHAKKVWRWTQIWVEMCTQFTCVIMVALKVSCPTARLIIPRRSAVEAVTLHCLDSSVWISSASLWDITDYNSVHWVRRTLCYSCWLNDAALQSPAFWDSVGRWWNYRAILRARLTCSICLMTKFFLSVVITSQGSDTKSPMSWNRNLFESCIKSDYRS